MSGEKSSNNEVGSIWAIFILGTLYESWPVRMDIDQLSVATKTKIEPPSDPEIFFEHLVHWLKTNNFIGYMNNLEGCIYDAFLTEKGISILKKKSPIENSDIGKTLTKLATSATEETGKAVISQIVGIIFSSLS